MADSRTGLGNRQHVLDYLIVSESKEVLKIKQKPTMMGYVKGTQKPTKRYPNGQNWHNLSDKIVLDYNTV